QAQDLVKQMRSKVKPDSCSGTRLLSPSLLHDGTISIEMRFEVHNITESFLGKQFFHSQEIGVPSAIVKNRKDQRFFVSKCYQFVCFAYSCCKRLVDDDVFSGIKRAFC